MKLNLPHKKPPSLEYICVFFILGLYLVISIININEPGVYYDEALFVNAALGNIDNSFITYQLQLGDLKIPLMLMQYIGAIKAWIYMPIFWLFGVSTSTIRIPAILIGYITLFFIYVFIKKIFDGRLALLSTLIIATDPSYIFHTRLDWGPIALMMLFKMGSLFFFVKWIKSKSSKSKSSVYLALTALFLGLGLYDKANFLWYIIALSITVPILFHKDISSIFNIRTVTIFIIFFIAGSLPFIIYNITYDGITFSDKNKLPTEIDPDITYKTNLLIATLDGSSVYERINGNSHLLDRGYGTILPYIFLFSVIYIVFVKNRYLSQNIIFILSLFTIILSEIYLTQKAGGSYHMMMIYPFPQITVGWFMIDIIDNIKNKTKNFRIVVTVLLTSTLIISNLVVDYRYIDSFRKIGGSGFWSDEIYDLVDYAESRPDNNFILMDWGFNTQFLGLSNNKVKKEELAWLFSNDPKYRNTTSDINTDKNTLFRYMNSTQSLFVFHSSQYVFFNKPRDIFEQILNESNLKEKIVKIFYQKDGQPIYFVSSVDR